MLGSRKLGSQYTISIHYKENGTRLAKYTIGPVHGSVTSTAGVAVDSNKRILASGGKGAIDTIKVQVHLHNGFYFPSLPSQPVGRIEIG